MDPESTNPINEVLLAVTVFAAVIALLIWIRAVVATRWKVGQALEIKSPDIVIALIPITLWLFLSGRVGSVRIGDFELKAALVHATQASVVKQVTTFSNAELPVHQPLAAEKGGVDLIQSLIENKTEALVFRRGSGHYYGPVIAEYLRRLTAAPFLKYVVVKDRDGRFQGIADARDTQREFAAGAGADAFERWINAKDEGTAPPLPGYIRASEAVRNDADKRSVLASLEKANSDFLPVVDSGGQFQGTVERARIVSSLILDVASRLQ